MDSLSFSNLSTLLAVKINLLPHDANNFAQDAPIPALAPVLTITISIVRSSIKTNYIRTTFPSNLGYG